MDKVKRHTNTDVTKMSTIHTKRKVEKNTKHVRDYGGFDDVHRLDGHAPLVVKYVRNGQQVGRTGHDDKNPRNTNKRQRQQQHTYVHVSYTRDSENMNTKMKTDNETQGYHEEQGTTEK